MKSLVLSVTQASPATTTVEVADVGTVVLFGGILLAGFNSTATNWAVFAQDQAGTNLARWRSADFTGELQYLEVPQGGIESINGLQIFCENFTTSQTLLGNIYYQILHQ